LEDLKQTLECTGDLVFWGKTSTGQAVPKRPFTLRGKGEFFGRLDSPERDINRVW
jgi:hypothetical protein